MVYQPIYYIFYLPIYYFLIFPIRIAIINPIKYLPFSLPMLELFLDIYKTDRGEELFSETGQLFAWKMKIDSFLERLRAHKENSIKRRKVCTIF